MIKHIVKTLKFLWKSEKVEIPPQVVHDPESESIIFVDYAEAERRVISRMTDKDFLFSMAGMFESGHEDTSEKVKEIVSKAINEKHNRG